MDLRQSLEVVPAKDRARALYRAVWGLGHFKGEISREPDKAWAMIDGVRAVRESKGARVLVAERELMEGLAMIAMECGDDLSEAPEKERQDRLEVFRQLSSYAMECLAFRRSRDTFGGQRRALAFEILEHAQLHIDLPDAVAAAHSAIHSETGVVLLGALDFLKRRIRNDLEAPSEEMVKELLKMAERAPDRSTARGLLEFLVDIGEINEMTALWQLDEWRDRNSGDG